MNSLTPFHLMAYEQLASGRGVGNMSSNNSGMSLSTNYSDKEKDELEILPNMTYASHKNLVASSKVCHLIY